MRIYVYWILSRLKIIWILNIYIYIFVDVSGEIVNILEGCSIDLIRVWKKVYKHLSNCQWKLIVRKSDIGAYKIIKDIKNDLSFLLIGYLNDINTNNLQHVLLTQELQCTRLAGNSRTISINYKFYLFCIIQIINKYK